MFGFSFLMICFSFIWKKSNSIGLISWQWFPIRLLVVVEENWILHVMQQDMWTEQYWELIICITIQLGRDQRCSDSKPAPLDQYPNVSVSYKCFILPCRTVLWIPHMRDHLRMMHLHGAMLLLSLKEFWGLLCMMTLDYKMRLWYCFGFSFLLIHKMFIIELNDMLLFAAQYLLFCPQSLDYILVMCLHT